MSATEETCSYCNGARQVLIGNSEIDCPECDGTGVVESTEGDDGR